MNAILLQTHFRATLPLNVGHGTKRKKEKINKYLEQLLPLHLLPLNQLSSRSNVEVMPEQ